MIFRRPDAGPLPGAAPVRAAAPEAPATAPDEAAPPASPSPPEGPQQPRPSLEERLGARWAVVVGGIALALGALLLVKYSIEAGLFGPAARLTGGALLAAALIAGGEFLRRREQDAAEKGEAVASPVSIPAVLTAAGIVAAFGTLYAAYALYQYIGQTLAFLLLGATGLVAMFAAALHGPALAALGLVGSFATPILVGGKPSSPWPLVVYLLVVAAAAYCVARLRRWLWLALAAAAGVALWQALLALAPGVGSFPWMQAAMIHIVAQLAIALVVFCLPLLGAAEENARPDALATGAPAVLTLLGLLTLLAAGLAGHFGVSWLVTALALVALNAAAGARVHPAAGLVAIAGFAVAATLRVWPHLEGAAPAFDNLEGWARFWPIPQDVNQHIAFAILASLAVLALCAQRLRHGAVAPAWLATIFAATGAATPLAALAIVYVRLKGDDVSYPFAAVAGALALLFAFLAGAVSRDDDGLPSPAARIGRGFFAAGALGALSLGLVMALSSGALTVGLALAAAGAAFIAAREDIAALRWGVAALGLAVAARLAWDPRIVADALGTRPVFNWLLFGYGVPALAFAFAARWLRRAPEDIPVRVAQALAILFSAFLVFFEIRHAVNNGDIYAPASTLLEGGLQTTAAFAFGLALALIGGRSPSPVWRAASNAFAVLSVTGAILWGGFVVNPLLTAEPVAGGPYLNALLAAYALPAALATLTAVIARGRLPEWRRTMAAVAALVLVFGYVTIETRRLFQGPIVSLWRTTTDRELYAYSAVWLALGVATLAYGVWRGSREARLGSAVFVLAAVLKVFLIDFSGLQGPLRAFSFIGLGLVLIAIGFVYQKLVFRRPAGA